MQCSETTFRCLCLKDRKIIQCTFLYSVNDETEVWHEHLVDYTQKNSSVTCQALWRWVPWAGFSSFPTWAFAMQAGKLPLQIKQQMHNAHESVPNLHLEYSTAWEYCLISNNIMKKEKMHKRLEMLSNIGNNGVDGLIFFNLKSYW